jgi:hypothetical protein
LISEVSQSLRAQLERAIGERRRSFQQFASVGRLSDSLSSCAIENEASAHAFEFAMPQSTIAGHSVTPSVSLSLSLNNDSLPVFMKTLTSKSIHVYYESIIAGN